MHQAWGGASLKRHALGHQHARSTHLANNPGDDVVITSRNIAQLLAHEPAPVDLVWGGFEAGTVGALIAPGGIGKTFFAIESAFAVATGSPGADLLDLHPCRPGRVVYFAGEDSQATLDNRIYDISRRIPVEAHQALIRNFSLFHMDAYPVDIMRKDHVSRLIEACAGARLVIFDTLSCIHTAEENDNVAMRTLMDNLRLLGLGTGAGILFLHHVSKVSQRDGFVTHQHAARGSSVLVDKARWCAYLAASSGKLPETPALPHGPWPNGSRNHYSDRIIFGISKQNGCSPLGTRWYRRTKNGVLVPLEGVISSSPTSGIAGHRPLSKKRIRHD